MVRKIQYNRNLRIKIMAWMTRFIAGLVSLLVLWFMIRGNVGMAQTSPLHPSYLAPTVQQSMTMTLPNPIFQRWLHSREEDEGDIQVYRPMDYAFPPARGREGLEFRQNGTFILYEIAPTDGNQAVTGQWQLEDNDRVQIQFPETYHNSYTLTVLDCNEQILKVRGRS